MECNRLIYFFVLQEIKLWSEGFHFSIFFFYNLSPLQHIFARDTRDEPVCPSRGYLVKLSQEFAGYTGGDVKFVKGEGELQLNQYLFWDIVSINQAIYEMVKFLWMSVVVSRNVS